MKQDGQARSREALLRQMKKLSQAKVNDAVKLAYLDGEQLDTLDGLDLTALTEFRRSGNGGVEIKLIDRVEVLERLLSLTREEEDMESFFQGLEEGGAAQ